MSSPAFDLILKGGHVIDPSSAINGVRDIGVTDGKIVSVSQNLQAAKNLVDVSGKYVCPGLIDLHGHWYEGSSFGVDPNICLNHGVTTVVDAGLRASLTFPIFAITQSIRLKLAFWPSFTLAASDYLQRL